MKKYLFMVVLFCFVLQAGVCLAASSVMIIANKKSATPGAMSIRSAAVKSSVQRVASYFVDQGIGVFDEAAMHDVYSEIEQAGRIDVDMPENDLVKLALDKHAEVLVIMEVFSINPSRGDETITVRAIAKMFNVSNGRILSMSEQYGSNLIPSWDQASVDAARTAASSKSGARIGKKLYKKLKNNHPRVLARIVRSDVPAYIIIFSGFSESENDNILDAIYDGMGIAEKNIRERKVTTGYIELEIFTERSFGQMTRKLKRQIKRQGVPISEKSRDGNKVIFIKKGGDLGEGAINIR